MTDRHVYAKMVDRLLAQCGVKRKPGYTYHLIQLPGHLPTEFSVVETGPAPASEATTTEPSAPLEEPEVQRELSEAEKLQNAKTKAAVAKIRESMKKLREHRKSIEGDYYGVILLRTCKFS